MECNGANSDGSGFFYLEKTKKKDCGVLAWGLVVSSFVDWMVQ